MDKRGFTLVEMLVVIGIIAILAGALAAGYAGATKTAQRTRGQELVTGVATALTSIYQQDGCWPPLLLNGNMVGKLDRTTGAVLASRGGFSLSKKDGQLVGQDKFGILDPWGAAVMKSNKNASLSTRVPGGGTIDDHIVRYAVDVDDDGIVEATVCGKKIRVRATAIAWCCGQDGVFQPFEQMGRSDDIFSFSAGHIAGDN